MTATSGNNGNVFWWLLFAIVTFVCVMGMIGCKSPCPIAGVDTETIIEVHHRDTTIITEADSASVKLLLRCDSANNVLIDEICAANGERLRMQLQLQALAIGTIATIDCNEDSLRNVIALQDSIIKTKTTQTFVRVEKQKDFVYWCGWVLIALVIGAISTGIMMLILKLSR